MFSTSTNTIVKYLLNRVTSYNLHPPSTCTNISYDYQSTQHQQVFHSGFYPSLVTRCGTFLQCMLARCLSPQQELILLQEEQFLRSAKQILRSLSRHKLRNLCDVIDGQGVKVGHCVPFLGTLQDQKQDSSLVDSIAVLTWFLYRLRNLNCNDQIIPPSLYHILQPLPWCTHHRHSSMDISYGRPLNSICLNPYHWSLIVFQDLTQVYQTSVPNLNQVELNVYQSSQLKIPSQALSHQYYSPPLSTPPPSYSEALHDDCLRLISPNTSGTTLDTPVKWCSLVYWEFQKRVGKRHDVKEDSVNVHLHPKLDGFAIPHSTQSNGKVGKILAKVGLGVCLFRDQHNSVWLYNRSSVPVFVNSQTLHMPTRLTTDTIRSAAMIVIKIQPGQLVKAYDTQTAMAMKSYWEHSRNNEEMDLLDFDSFRFSFVKGFGANYKCQNILQCPCWMEVILEAN